MENNNFAAAYKAEMEAEYTSSKKCLERIPETLYEFKPHPKSMNMGYLTLLVAEIPLWLHIMIEEGEIDFATYKHVQPKTTQEMLDHFEDNFKKAQKSLLNTTDEALQSIFYLKANGKILYQEPKIKNISATINHWVHHRGQLTVYMRLNDIPVPSIYGPSADDKSF